MAKRGEFFVMSNCNNYLFCHEKFLHCTYFIYLSVSTLGIAEHILQQFITEIALTNSKKLSSVSSDGRGIQEWIAVAFGFVQHGYCLSY